MVELFIVRNKPIMLENVVVLLTVLHRVSVLQAIFCRLGMLSSQQQLQNILLELMLFTLLPI
jgi:hypothetical protein